MQAIGQTREQRVAGRMTERVVVLLEPIEVKQRQDQLVVLAGVRDSGLKVAHQGPAVGRPVSAAVLASSRDAASSRRSRAPPGPSGYGEPSSDLSRIDGEPSKRPVA